jgi:hypothetical protein
VHIIIGITNKEDRMRTNPQTASIQLAKSFNNPKSDFANIIIPKTNKNVEETLKPTSPVPNNKINPANISTTPRILTSMFFKLKLYLKTYSSPSNSAWIECHPPKVDVVGSNPISGVTKLINLFSK